MRKLFYYIYVGLATIVIGAIVIIDILIGIYTPIPGFENFFSESLFMVALIFIVVIGIELIKKFIKKFIKWFKK